MSAVSKIATADGSRQSALQRLLKITGFRLVFMVLGFR